MPSKSPAQHKLMEAAAHTPGGFGGVPQSVGKEFVATDESEEDREGEKNEPQVHDSAGIIFVAPNGHVLFLRRDQQANHGGTWDWPGGHLEPGETLLQGAIRESHEECGYLAPAAKVREMSRAITEDMDFTTFVCPVDEMFTPNISRDEFGHREHDDWRWADPRDPPEPLHPGIEEVLGNPMIEDIIRKGDVDPEQSEEMPENIEGNAEDSLGWRALTGAVTGLREDADWDTVEIAMDWLLRYDDLLALDKASVRSYDADGRLHIALTPITRAMICPYLGREIPWWKESGLDPNKVYRLFRDPEEIAEGAASANGIPLLERHKPTSADDHPSDIVVGATGTDAVFQYPFLMQSLVIWPAYAIEDVEDETKIELSASYRFDVDWTPGTFEGEPYDGRMIGPRGGPGGLVFNHVAMVEQGRSGPTVAIADALSDDIRWALLEEAICFS